jgi:hypothetical protein
MDPNQTPEKLMEQLQTVEGYEEQVQEFLKYMQENFDPTDYMTPTQREIARMPADQFQAEYELVIKKESSRSAAQRRYITERYEQEQNATRETTNQQDTTNA